MSARTCVLVVVLAACLGGCTTAGSDATSRFAAAASGTSAPMGAVSVSPDYRIGAQDMLEVSVFQVPDLNKTVQVNSSGQIGLPLIGAVTAAGRTVEQLQSDIAAKLGAKYLQSPQVSVFVKEALSQRVTIEGAVGKPGIYPTTGQTTLLQVVAIAGGLTEIADPSGVVVFRTAGGKKQAAKFDFAAIRKGSVNDPVVYGGDVIVVDQSGMKATLRNITQAIPVFGLFSPLL